MNGRIYEASTFKSTVQKKLLIWHMQKRKYLPWLLAGILLLVGLYCFISFKNDYDQKIARHIRVADSLKHYSMRLDRQLYQRDSVLSIYMKSLDEALKALQEKNVRNRILIAGNLSKLDSLQTAYCLEMHKLGVTVLDCQ